MCIIHATANTCHLSRNDSLIVLSLCLSLDSALLILTTWSTEITSPTQHQPACGYGEKHMGCKVRRPVFNTRLYHLTKCIINISQIA